MYFKNLYIFPSRQHISRTSQNEEWISALPLHFFPPVHFQSETDFVRQVSSCMLRCATSRVTRCRKRELWKFRRAAPSTPFSLSLSLYHSCIHPLKFQTPSLAIDITFVRRSKTFSSFMIHRLLSCSDDSCLFRSFGCLSVVRMQTSSNPLFRVEERDSRDING